jgi:hypothetical protein
MRLAVLTAVLTISPGVALAGGPAVPGDHLKCYKPKDTADPATYTADLLTLQNSFPQESGCTVKVPAKLLCTSVAKTNVDPAPPGAQTGAVVLEEFACYKLKCPKGEFDVMVTDQFGSRSMTVKAPKLLCAPANVLPPG